MKLISKTYPQIFLNRFFGINTFNSEQIDMVQMQNEMIVLKKIKQESLSERRQMTFRQDVLDLKKHLDEIHSIEEMRLNLLERDLRLTVSIYTLRVQCLEWDIIDKKIAGILDLGLYIKLAKKSAENVSVTNDVLYTVLINQKDWTDQEDLAERIAQGIKSCIRALRP